MPWYETNADRNAKRLESNGKETRDDGLSKGPIFEPPLVLPVMPQYDAYHGFSDDYLEYVKPFEVIHPDERQKAIDWNKKEKFQEGNFPDEDPGILAKMPMWPQSIPFLPPVSRPKLAPVWKVAEQVGGMSRKQRLALAQRRKYVKAMYDQALRDNAKAAFWKKKAYAKWRQTGVGLAFQIGWEIGDYLFPVGHWIYQPSGPQDPLGWTSPNWCLFDCGAQGEGQGFAESAIATVSTVGDGSCPAIGGSFGSQSCHPATPGVSQSVTVYASPGEVPMAFPPNVNPISYLSRSPAGDAIGKWEVSATYWPDSGAQSGPEAWENTTGQPGTVVTAPLTRPFPQEFPQTWPMLQPMAPPFPQKWADAKEPKLEPGTGTTTATYPMPPFPVTLVEPLPDAAPINPPTTVITVTPPTPSAPRGRIKRGYRNERPKRKRPHRRMKERKISVRSVAGKFWIGLNIATEVQDALEALNKGLPKHLRAKPKGGDHPEYGYGIGKPLPWDILQAVWEHWDQFNATDFVNAFIENQIEDLYYGGLGQAGKKLNQVSGASTGGSIVDGGSEYIEEATGEPLEPVLPKLWYDEQAATWFVEIPGVYTGSVK